MGPMVSGQSSRHREGSEGKSKGRKREYLDLVERLKYYKTIIIIILMITFEN